MDEVIDLNGGFQTNICIWNKTHKQMKVNKVFWCHWFGHMNSWVSAAETAQIQVGLVAYAVIFFSLFMKWTDVFLPV